MILKSEELKRVCNIIKQAVDTKGNTLISDTLELIGANKKLTMNVTDRDYYVSVSFDLAADEDLNAAVEAKKFLDLVNQMTSENITLTTTQQLLNISGNGKYKLPLIFNGQNLLTLPTIPLNNPTVNMQVPSETLQSILKHNSKELLRGKEYVKNTASGAVNSLYYIDEKGAITCTIGACVNEFTLPAPISIYVPDKVVKLFKLFKDVENVTLTLGQESLASGIIQTILKLEAPNVTLVANLGDASLIKPFPIKAVRDMASKNYAFTATLNKDELLGAINRLLLLGKNTIGSLTFAGTMLTVTDEDTINSEEIPLMDLLDTPYTAHVDLKGLRLILSTAEDSFITIKFGDQRSVAVKKASVTDILPEWIN